MINVTKLYCSRSISPGLSGHYQTDRPPRRETLHLVEVSPISDRRKPVLVWNATRACNLDCLHCYAESQHKPHAEEISTVQARAMIKDLAGSGVRELVFAGGEPLLRPGLAQLVAEAHDFGLRAQLATNGTLITPGVAASLKSAGLDYAAISLATVGPANDRLRGKKGAFNAAMAGFRNCLQAGLDAGLRLTLAQRSGDDLDAVFSLLECENVPQVCFHHLAYAGRGNAPLRDALSHSETRRIMDLILRRSEDFYRRGSRTEILTQDNYADGAYLCQKLAKKAPADAARVYALLKRSGGGARGSGVGIGNIDAEGNVHPDQYWSHYTLGNIVERPFSQIWSDLSDPLLAGLQDRLPRLKGRCANCRWQAVCGGNLRVRADQVYGDPWMPDPACYLSNEEISRERPNSADSLEDNVLLEKQAA